MIAKKVVSSLLVVAVLFSIQTEAVKIETKATSPDDDKTEADLWNELGHIDPKDDKELEVESLY